MSTDNDPQTVSKMKSASFADNKVIPLADVTSNDDTKLVRPGYQSTSTAEEEAGLAKGKVVNHSRFFEENEDELVPMPMLREFYQSFFATPTKPILGAIFSFLHSGHWTLFGSAADPSLFDVIEQRDFHFGLYKLSLAAWNLSSVYQFYAAYNRFHEGPVFLKFGLTEPMKITKLQVHWLRSAMENLSGYKGNFVYSLMFTIVNVTLLLYAENLANIYSAVIVTVGTPFALVNASRTALLTVHLLAGSQICVGQCDKIIRNVEAHMSDEDWNAKIAQPIQDLAYTMLPKVGEYGNMAFLTLFNTMCYIVGCIAACMSPMYTGLRFEWFYRGVCMFYVISVAPFLFTPLLYLSSVSDKCEDLIDSLNHLRCTTVDGRVGHMSPHESQRLKNMTEFLITMNYRQGPGFRWWRYVITKAEVHKFTVAYWTFILGLIPLLLPDLNTMQTTLDEISDQTAYLTEVSAQGATASFETCQDWLTSLNATITLN